MTNFDNIIDILEHSLHSINQDKFNQLVKNCSYILKAKNKIIISGLGKNVPVCEKFVGTMNSLGLNSCYMNTNSATHGDIGLVHSGDLVIVLTKSGETAESIYLVDLLEKRNCTIWLLTFSQENTLTKRVPNVLSIDLQHEGDLWNIIPNNSTTINLIVLQELAMSLSKELSIELSDFKSNHPGGHIGEVLKYEQ